MGINLEEFFINYELDQMSRYLDMANNALSQKFEKTEAEYELDIERELEDYEDTDAVIDEYQDKYIELARDFPKLIFGSFVVAWFSFVEQKLLDICEARQLRISISVKENANLGKGILRAKKFLFESANCKIDNKHWQELVSIQHLRNYIVHKGYGLTSSYIIEPEKPYVLYKTDNEIPTYLKKYSMIFELSWAYIEIAPTRDYCEHLVGFGKEFFKSLFNNLEKNKKHE